MRISAHPLISAIASGPRAAGSEGEERARAHCSAILSQRGFSVSEERFSYSAFPGKVATPIAGVVLLLGSAAVAVTAARGFTPLATLIAAAALADLAFLLLMSSGTQILSSPVMRREGVNLVGVPQDGKVRVWLVAHLDSKSQPVSILLRAAGASVAGFAFATLLALLAMQWSGSETPTSLWYIIGAVGVAGAIPVALSVVRNGSDGALDNATGVAAVLIAATTLARSTPGVGVVLTTAEELGLAGGHALGAAHPRGLAINCDTLDDSGGFLILTGGRSATPVVRALRAALDGEGHRHRSLRWLSSVLVDSVALQARGWDSATLCKGSLRTLAVVHTRRDRSVTLSGRGAEEGAGVLVRACRELLADC